MRSKFIAGVDLNIRFNHGYTGWDFDIYGSVEAGVQYQAERSRRLIRVIGSTQLSSL